jgi:cytochrome c oxidase assembly protein subunit 11
VSPDQAGSFFDKINCFCFNEQTLAAGESVDMPVVFFLDPALEKDETMSRVDSVTLSYTFYPVRSQPVAAASDRPKL